MKILIALVLGITLAGNADAHGWNGYGCYHSSTAQEGYLRGAGCYVQSWGMGNYYNSLAALTYQNALSQAYDNYLKRVETRFEARLMNKKYRDQLDPYKPYDRDSYLYMHEYYKSKNVEPGIHFNGNVYRTFQDFKCSRDYKLMIRQRDRREFVSDLYKELDRAELQENYEREWVRRQTPRHLLDRQERTSRLQRLGILD